MRSREEVIAAVQRYAAFGQAVALDLFEDPKALRTPAHLNAELLPRRHLLSELLYVPNGLEATVIPIDQAVIS